MIQTLLKRSFAIRQAAQSIETFYLFLQVLFTNQTAHGN